MKAILLAAALIAAPAFAQTTNSPPQQDPATGSPGAPSTMQTMPAPTSPAAPTDGTMPAPTDGSMAMPAQSNTLSPPAAQANAMSPVPGTMPTGSYPMCSKTVTDSCRERGGRK